uniref:Predicted protein n=1 Tax=Hordeum vulgare subsp. vulgare TaxID=112509 RepID=F2EIB3_HORVV|nr:predicted protein [Hordeum vulgare subsp. vulgare]
MNQERNTETINIYQRPKVSIDRPSLPEALPERREHEVRVALRAPELGRDEHLLPGRQEPAAHRLREGLAQGPLRRVHGGRVEVAVAELHGLQHGLHGRLRHHRELGGAHADRRHGPRVAGPQRHLRHRRCRGHGSSLCGGVHNSCVDSH